MLNNGAATKITNIIDCAEEMYKGSTIKNREVGRGVSFEMKMNWFKYVEFADSGYTIWKCSPRSHMNRTSIKKIWAGCTSLGITA